MKTRMLLLALLMGTATTIFAQTSTVEETVEYSNDKFKVETNRFWDNWFVTAGAGAQVYFGDHDNRAPFGKRLAPAFDVAVGKWFTPGFGVRLVYSGQQIKGATKWEDSGWENAYGTGEAVGDPIHGLQRQKYDMGNFHIDALLNLNNLFAGYNPERVWHCSFYGGLGWAWAWGDGPSTDGATANVGLLNTFRLCDALDLNVDVRGMFANDHFDGEGGGRFGEGNLSLSVGLTYKFKKRGWDRAKTIYRTDYGDLNAMREKLNQMGAENERLKKLLAEKKPETIVKQIAGANLVTFPINKSTLSNEARANLGLLAKIIKEGDQEVVYTITGYADAGTGSVKGNEKLSKERAEAVFKCLTEEFGVKASQLSVDYKGGVDNMFYDDPRLSRAVITCSK